MRTVCFLTVLLLAGITGSSDNGPIVVRNLALPGFFEVENQGPRYEVQWTVDVERRNAGAWSPVESQVTLHEQCEPPARGECRVLEKGEKIDPVWFDGFSCNVKCSLECTPVQHSPGTFRMVVTSCDGSKKFYGPAFEMK